MVVIELDHLTKRYGDTVGIEDVTFSVGAGEVFGYLGPNGAGKTTTIRTLLGLLSPTAGSGTMLGHDIATESELLRAKERIGYLPDSLGFDDGVTGRRILAYQAAIKGDDRLDRMHALFDPPLDRKIRAYSHGNRRMLGIILAFMHDPDLVIMDEPTAGLDPIKKERFYAFLREEQERGTTIFFSSHILSEVRRICNRVGILRDGRLITLEDIESLLDRGGKRVTVQFGTSVTADDIDIDGVQDPVQTATAWQFTFTGEYSTLLSHLGHFDIVEIEIAEPPLEDVFMHYYGDNSTVETENSPAQTGEEHA